MTRTKYFMTDSDREAIYIMADEGLPYKIIAHIMNRPQGTINGVISKGILEGKVKRRIDREDKRKE